eukprot:scaffold175508_cov22-Tisochrysis_lutea.AAC.1
MEQHLHALLQCVMASEGLEGEERLASSGLLQKAHRFAGYELCNLQEICWHRTSRARQAGCLPAGVHAHLAQGTAYHIARKQIPSKDGPVQGIKLELFIFDPFPIANKVALMEVARSEHFAPVKVGLALPFALTEVACKSVSDETFGYAAEKIWTCARRRQVSMICMKTKHNARGSASDTPDTARDAFLALGAKWLRDAGAVLELPPGRAGVEVPAS